MLVYTCTCCAVYSNSKITFLALVILPPPRLALLSSLCPLRSVTSSTSSYASSFTSSGTSTLSPTNLLSPTSPTTPSTLTHNSTPFVSSSGKGTPSLFPPFVHVHVHVHTFCICTFYTLYIYYNGDMKRQR